LRIPPALSKKEERLPLFCTTTRDEEGAFSFFSQALSACFFTSKEKRMKVTIEYCTA
jgi:hypothetical protein